jgi:hypothetical protein
MGDAVAGVGQEYIHLVGLAALQPADLLLGDDIPGQAAGQVVALDDPGREPARRVAAGLGHGRQARQQGGDGGLDGAVVADLHRRDRQAVHGPQQFTLEVFDALTAGRGHWHHGAAQACREPLGVDQQALVPGYVHHVQGHHQGAPHLDQLGGQVEVALQVGRIQDVQDQVRLAGMDEVPGDAFVQGHLLVGHVQGVGPGQVHQVEVAALEAVAPGLALHRHAGPIAHPLLGAGQGIEQGRLAAVGVAHHADGEGLAVGLGVRGVHTKGSTCKAAASSLRRLTEAPRTRTSTGSPRGATRTTWNSMPGVRPMDRSFRR